jgi:hypothetical protein
VNKSKKQTKQKQLYKISKGVLATILAGTVAFPATNVFADETINETAIIDLQAKTSSTTETVESPSLLPGDFFYFTKILMEKIHLAVTSDDVKEAKLVAEFATERLAEAEALFAEGNEQAALETMKTAIENIENADEQVSIIDQEATEEVVEDETELGEVKDVLSQNIIALTAAMEKVKNPVSKAALKKNIEKSYTKLAKKMEKWEKKQKKTNEIIREETVSTEIIEESDSEKTSLEVTLPVTQQPSKKEIQQTAVQERKIAKQETIQHKKEAKSLAKETKVETKKAPNQGKKETKQNNGNGN